ncbi:MAG: hypothetical protein V5A61_11740 [Haloarculaceae archaeon]
MPSRRRTLALLAGGLPVAGCSSPGHPAPPARLDGVWLVNDRTTPQDVRVTVSEVGETVFETTRRLGTFGEPTPNDGNVVVDAGLAEPGQYLVTVTVGGEESTVDAARAVDGAEDCVLVRFTLTRGSGIQSWTRAYRRCEAEEGTP